MSKLRLLIILTITSNRSISFETSSNGLKICKSSHKPCTVTCRNLDLNSPKDAREIVQGKEKYCELILNRCTYSESRNNSQRNEHSFKALKILNSQINLNEFELKSFRNLRSLILQNTTTTALYLRVFCQVPKLRKLKIKKENLIKSSEECLLHGMSLNSLQIHGINLNQTESRRFFGNLTCGRDVIGIRHLDWSHNNFGNLTEDLLIHFPNLRTLVLTNSSIFNIEGEAFSRGLISLRINSNKLRRLPENVFGPIIENVFLFSFGDNELICDCEMEWLQNLAKAKRHIFQDSQFVVCAHPENSSFLETEMCPKVSTTDNNGKILFLKETTQSVRCSLTHNWSFLESNRKLSILNSKPGFLEINLSSSVNLSKSFLWYIDYSNSLPVFNCLKMFQQNLTIQVKPDVSYIICLTSAVEILDCFPIKTKPLYENQTWLTNKSISLTIVCGIIGFLFGLAIGALILYLSVRKNPSLIRGSKRVIEVKRHDKAKVLIMPRGYESVRQTDTSSVALSRPLKPSRSCDTMSTVSYISAIQPTQLEILAYRLNRFREVFRRNNQLPRQVPSLPVQISSPRNRRLPPNVDLLFEYEWYTITTTTTTQQ